MCNSSNCCGKLPKTCAAPAPRETNNYYSRHHTKNTPDSSSCKGSCYCPESCCCSNKQLNMNRCDCDMCRDNCNPCGGECCTPCCGPCPPKPKPCNPCGPCSPCGPCCRDKCCPPCCPPYCPPPRKPICYPPIKCCEGRESPRERICYYPAPQPCQPKYCPCGLPNPCECDLNIRRKQAICEKSPCCRRCGRKVYAAEKIMAANGAFHSSCFSCYCCHKPLEVTNVYENQGEIYCKQCYARYFGVTGYGYGSTLQSSMV